MPELPEVETTLRGIEPFVNQAAISDVVIRNAAMRWPVPVQQLKKLIGQRITRVERRAKYILMHTGGGTILLHLGMSGSLRVLDDAAEAGKHDHIDIVLENRKLVRMNDPRRFGCCLLLDEPIDEHKLLATLGPEPLSDAFDGDYLFTQSRARQVAIKNFVMDGKVVVGVGNIYVSESLFKAGIRPTVQARRVSRARYHRLADAIKQVLTKAIEAGGTTLNDFTQVDGKPGYFRHELQVYARVGKPCLVCDAPIKSQIVGQRNTFFCSHCQHF